MPVQPGEPLYSNDINETRPADSTVDAGDGVLVASSGELVPATDTDTLAGIARFSGEDAPSENVLTLSGVVVANVNTTDADGAVTEGVSITASPTAGALYRDYSTDTNGNPVYDQPGSILALSDEGGSWSGHGGTIDVPAGYAVVYVQYQPIVS